MDELERRRRKSDFANEPEISDRDRPLLTTPAGREPGTYNEKPGPADDELADKIVGAQPRSAVTDHPDQGGDEETSDGLNAQSEAIRSAIEDEPVREDSPRSDERTPVFDRGEAPPKIRGADFPGRSSRGSAKRRAMEPARWPRVDWASSSWIRGTMFDTGAMSDDFSRQLQQIESELHRLDACLKEKPSPAIKAALEQEFDALTDKRDQLLARVAVASSKGGKKSYGRPGAGL